jgi:hypothetical protein
MEEGWAACGESERNEQQESWEELSGLGWRADNPRRWSWMVVTASYQRAIMAAQWHIGDLADHCRFIHCPARPALP